MNREDLEYDISIAVGRWDGVSTFVLAGVEGLTRYDLDTLKMCCDHYEEYGSLCPFWKFPDPLKEVLVRYGML